jgi:hypothetical protein
VFRGGRDVPYSASVSPVIRPRALVHFLGFDNVLKQGFTFDSVLKQGFTFDNVLKQGFTLQVQESPMTDYASALAFYVLKNWQKGVRSVECACYKAHHPHDAVREAMTRLTGVFRSRKGSVSAASSSALDR